MRRARARLALACCVGLLCGDAAAQDLFDIFGPDRPARPARRAAPDAAPAGKARKKPEAARAKKPRDAPKSQPDAGAPAPSGAEAPPPPYEGQLVRLSEVLGALAFLRDLCEEKDGEEWRDKMSALIAAEAPGGPRRDKYVAAFNRGFHSYELTYRRCTPNARDATTRYLDEAAKISREVSYRFGSP